MKNSIFSNHKISDKIILVMMVFAMYSVLFAIPLSAAENAKIKLPDGLYMYGSSIEKLQDGRVRVGFGKYFVVINNIIYSSKEAIRKFGVVKLNKLFTENKKYKILFGGEQIGKIYNVRIDSEEDWGYKEELLTKNIKEGPAYGRESIKIKGSAVKCLAVPEEYKEIKKIVYTTIPQGEVDIIAKRAREKLYPMVENKTKTHGWSLYEENLERLDKISDRNGELYIGVYNFAFKKPFDARQWSYWDDKMIFSAKNSNVHFITGEQDEGWMTICGMLDVDGDGDGELIIERTFGDEDGSTTTLEIHKQKTDGNWTLIYKK